MASNLNTCSRATPRATSSHHFQTLVRPLQRSFLTNKSKSRIVTVIRASDDEKSYLGMWRNAVERERKSVEFENIAVESQGIDSGGREGVDMDKKSEDFKKILEVSREERDRIQRMQVIDRAAAAIAAARALIKEKGSETADDNGGGDTGLQSDTGGGTTGFHENKGGAQKGSSIFASQSESSGNGVPGPDFWSWTPPSNSEKSPDDFSDLQQSGKPGVYPTLINPVGVKERSMDFLSIPFESRLSDTISNPVIPPLQSMLEVEKVEVSESSLKASSRTVEEHELGSLSSVHAAEVARALEKDKEDQFALHGINPDGSRWWKETGMERRPDGVICRWTMFRGVSADQETEWQEKFWEAADDFGYKELASEKSGRDVFGNVWREFWRESMWQESGLVHLEKTADKWGKNGTGDEWQEKWWEHYDASGKADKWAHKWCSIDPTTPLVAGHAHVWHERWGEKYDGYGGSIKYTDKWAERCEGDGWSKWGDKWDENFDTNGHGVKQGETWWAGKHGERWNRTWGERHNGSGWLHKYGKSSSGEHWDTHVQQDTWYERFPHYGFYHCFDNSVQLRQVQKPSERL